MPTENVAARAEEIFALVPLFREIGNLKRIRAANLGDKSFAAGLFERAWSEIKSGADAQIVALEITASAIIAASLGAINGEVLREAQLDEALIELILLRAFDASAASVNESLRDAMRGRISLSIESKARRETPNFVRLLIAQPRSGATKFGAPKRIFDQPENHAEHCLAVAVIGSLLARKFGAAVETVFLIGLIHHFHNAYLPDSGFAGEEALGEFLPAIFESFRRKCLAELPANLHEKIWKLFTQIETADTPEAKAFHAADVIDRVLQMRHHAEANEFTLRYAMEEAELVHAGAVQSFHYEILRAAQLI